ncbi:DUF6461 domain-containing protein [Nocardia takedensis]|uniref:DUF6461 domain-containing protein n=1 Tax=Nocardia takedensis TaxID=259390 RepID=UPI000319ECDB|nr:DUF6461 domain-containing protein [Nocardia takedensis]
MSALEGRLRGSGERVDLDAVFARPYDLGVTTVGGWTLIADPQVRVTFDDRATAEVTARGQVLAWVSNSVSSVDGFAFYRDGVPIRRIMHAEARSPRTRRTAAAGNRGRDVERGGLRLRDAEPGDRRRAG